MADRARRRLLHEPKVLAVLRLYEVEAAVENQIFPNVPFLTDLRHERHFMLPQESGGMVAVARAFAYHSMIMPAIEVSSYRWQNTVLSVNSQASPLTSGGWWGAIATCRAQCVLLSAQGVGTRAIARTVGRTPRWVRLWRDRFARDRLWRALVQPQASTGIYMAGLPGLQRAGLWLDWFGRSWLSRHAFTPPRIGADVLVTEYPRGPICSWQESHLM